MQVCQENCKIYLPAINVQMFSYGENFMNYQKRK